MPQAPSPNIEQLADPISFQRGNIAIDLRRRMIFRGTERIALGPKPFEVLEFLARHQGRIVSKDELLQTVWGEQYKERNTVEQAVRQIRVALGEDAENPLFIQTIPRRGYCFMLPPEQSPPSPVERSHVSRKRFSWFFVSVGVILAAGIIPLVFSRPHHIPARFNFLGDSVTVQGGNGRTLWTHRFSGILDPRGVDRTELSKIADFTRVVDLRGDNEREVIIVAPIRSNPNIQVQDRVEIDCFSDSGKLLWSYVPQAALEFPGLNLTGPWYLFDILVSQRSTDRSVYAVFAQAFWGHSFVARIDPLSGRGSLFFVNTGTLRSLSEISIGSATYLLVGGFNNEYDGGSVAMIDERRSFASSPQTTSTRHQCLNCPPGAPDYYFVFPRSELNRLNTFNENSVVGIEVRDRELLVRKRESESATEQQTLYLFSVPPVPKSVYLRFETHYDRIHRELEKSGRLDHSLVQCPERLHPTPVRVWTPTDGWADLAVQAIQ